MRQMNDVGSGRGVAETSIWGLINCMVCTANRSHNSLKGGLSIPDSAIGIR